MGTMLNREHIMRFRNEYDFLSNFYPARIETDGVVYYSAEAAYQAQKCRTPEERLQFVRVSADEAKRLGSRVQMREDWEAVRLPVMEQIVSAKFRQNPYLAEWLLQTGTLLLQEGNTWGDTFWGVDVKNGIGENHLGKILMHLRETFQNANFQCQKTTADWLIQELDHSISSIYGDITQTACGGIVLTDSICPERIAGHSCFHANEPRYGTPDCENRLQQEYFRLLSAASNAGVKCLAFPVLSVGKCSFPKSWEQKLLWILLRNGYSTMMQLCKFNCIARISGCLLLFMKEGTDYDGFKNLF